MPLGECFLQREAPLGSPVEKAFSTRQRASLCRKHSPRGMSGTPNMLVGPTESRFGLGSVPGPVLQRGLSVWSKKLFRPETPRGPLSAESTHQEACQALQTCWWVQLSPALVLVQSLVQSCKEVSLSGRKSFFDRRSPRRGFGARSTGRKPVTEIRSTGHPQDRDRDDHQLECGSSLGREKSLIPGTILCWAPIRARKSRSVQDIRTPLHIVQFKKVDPTSPKTLGSPV